MAELTLPSTRDAYIAPSGKPTPAFFDSLARQQKTLGDVARIPVIASRDDSDLSRIPSGAAGALVLGDNPPAPYVSRLNEPSHAGKFYRNGQWFELERYDGVYLTDFTGATNGVIDASTLDYTGDNSDPLQDCIDYCVAKQRMKIRMPSGMWCFQRDKFEFPVGLRVVGDGHSSSFLYGGTALVGNYNAANASDPFFHWSGSGSSSNSTGGGMEGVSIWARNGKTIGCALKLTGVNDSNRPGYMDFSRILIAGETAGSMSYCIIHDGSNLTTSGTQGLRDIVYNSLWLSGANAETFQLANATWARLTNVQISQGTGSASPILRISGDSNASTHKTTGLEAVGLNITGTLIVDNAQECVISGRATDVTLTGNVTNTLLYVKSINAINYSGTSRNALAALGTYVVDGSGAGTTFGTTTNGGVYLEGRRIRKWMTVTGVGTGFASYAWSTFLGGSDVPFTSTPTLISLCTGSGALSTFGFQNLSATAIELRANAASQVATVVAEGPY